MAPGQHGYGGVQPSPFSVPPNAGRGLHLVQRGGPGVSPFAAFAEALTPLPGSSGSDAALLSRLGLSTAGGSCSLRVPASGPAFSPRIDPPPSVAPNRRESLGAAAMVAAASSARPNAPGTSCSVAGGTTTTATAAAAAIAAAANSVHRPRLSSAGFGEAVGSIPPFGEGVTASTADVDREGVGGAGAPVDPPRRSPRAASHRSPYGADHINQRLSGGKRSATGQGNGVGATAGTEGSSVGASIGSGGNSAGGAAASLAPGSGAAFDSDKRNKTASRKQKLFPSKLSQGSGGLLASGASSAPMSVGGMVAPMSVGSAPRSGPSGGVLGGALDPGSTVRALVDPAACESGAPGGSGGSSGSGSHSSGNSFIKDFAAQLEGSGINLGAHLDQVGTMKRRPRTLPSLPSLAPSPPSHPRTLLSHPSSPPFPSSDAPRPNDRGC